MNDTRNTIGIIGMGEVGAAVAYACMIRGVADRYLLHDLDHDKARAHGMDLAHGQAFCPPSEVDVVESVGDLHDADVIVITAGAKQRPGETRLDLTERNAGIMADLLPRLFDAAPRAVLLMVTNPVDVMTMIAIDAGGAAGVDPSRILGSGTVLDTARFRHLLARRLDVAPASVHAYIVGEHGDSEIPLWSSAAVGGTPLHIYQPRGKRPLTVQERSAILQQVRGAAYEIIRGKGATSQAIGVSAARILAAIVHDEHAVLPVSSQHERFGDLRIEEPVCFSAPTILGRGGVVRVIHELPLNDAERAGLEASAATIRAAYEQSRTASGSASQG